MLQRPLVLRLSAACALCVATLGAAAQTPTSSLPQLPISTNDQVRPLLPAQLRDFDAYVESARKAFDVPGIAVAIVKDGNVVLARGFGQRELGKPDAVDAHT